MAFRVVAVRRLQVRTAEMVVVVAGLLVSPGCWVQSINGLNEAELLARDRDRVYEPNLLGTWTATSEDCVTTLMVTAQNMEYHWKITASGEGCSGNKGEVDYYEGELYKLGDHRFLDLTARSEDVCQACLAIHWILKFEGTNGSFRLSPIDSEWLEKAEKEKTVTLGTVHGNPYILTASPKELKAFCRKYANDESVFKPSPDFTFERKRP